MDDIQEIFIWKIIRIKVYFYCLRNRERENILTLIHFISFHFICCSSLCELQRVQTLKIENDGLKWATLLINKLQLSTTFSIIWWEYSLLLFRWLFLFSVEIGENWKVSLNLLKYCPFTEGKILTRTTKLTQFSQIKILIFNREGKKEE